MPQSPKISLADAMRVVRQVLDAWPASPAQGDWRQASWDAYHAAEVLAVAPLVALGASIDDFAGAREYQRIRFARVTATSTSGLLQTLNNWMHGAQRRLCGEART